MAAVIVGLLFDFPQPDGGAFFEHAVRLGIADVAAVARVPVEIELVAQHSQGHPFGSPTAVVEGFGALADAGVGLVIGPSISDNAVEVRRAADERGLVSINYSGGERTRGPWAFHYQVGSLEEEPPVLAARLALRDLRRVAVLHDASVVGRRYRECLAWAAPAHGLEVVEAVPVDPLVTVPELEGVLVRLRASEPEALVYLGLGAASYAVAGALAAEGWGVPVVANSALMFGYARPDWRDAWAGWEYVDTVADDNEARAALATRDRRVAAGPIGCAAYDLGRAVAEAVARADRVDRNGLRDGLERVKQLPATSGHDGTLLGFGVWDRAALKGHYLVLREWRDGRSVAVT